jgi:hypothetical protein
LKQLKHEVEHPLPSNAEVKNEWNYTSVSPYVFVAFTGTTDLILLDPEVEHTTVL